MCKTRQSTIRRLKDLKKEYSQLLSIEKINELLNLVYKIESLRKYWFDFKLRAVCYSDYDDHRNYYHDDEELNRNISLFFDEYTHVKWLEFEKQDNLYNFYLENFTGYNTYIFTGICAPKTAIENNWNIDHVVSYIKKYIEKIDSYISLLEYVETIDNVKEFNDFVSEKRKNEFIS